jgi:hypothetical protein
MPASAASKEAARCSFNLCSDLLAVGGQKSSLIASAFRVDCIRRTTTDTRTCCYNMTLSTLVIAASSATGRPLPFLASGHARQPAGPPLAHLWGASCVMASSSPATRRLTLSYARRKPACTAGSVGSVVGTRSGFSPALSRSRSVVRSRHWVCPTHPSSPSQRGRTGEKSGSTRTTSSAHQITRRPPCLLHSMIQ